MTFLTAGVSSDSSGSTSKVIHFCGHRLHVHSKFQLYLTTTTHPSALPTSLTSILNVVNLSSSIPLAQDVLTTLAFQTLFPEGYQRFRQECEEIAKLKGELRELEKKVFESLPKERNMENYWQSTDKISSLLRTKHEVCSVQILASKVLSRTIVG